ncbi:MAG: hypothetical protein MUF51_06035 [Vicinamibacteria bacterium]|nr:hypothetical protein [Vicinamibacteria bacterium]
MKLSVHSRQRRAFAIRGGIALALACALASACSRSARPREYRFEDLGIPQTPRAVITSAVTGSTLLATLFETKGRGRLLRVDLEGGRSTELPLGKSTGAYALLIDEQRGFAYIGTFRVAQVWQYDLKSGALAPIAALDPLLAADSHVFSLGLSASGLLYVGTFPSGRLIEYDTRGGRARDVGQALAGRMYVHSLFVSHKGTVLCALGTPAAIVSYDPRARRFTKRLATDDAQAAFASFARNGRDLAAQAGAQSLVISRNEPETQWRRGLPPRAQVTDEGRFEVANGARRFDGRIDLAPKQDGMMTMGLFAGPDGAVYGATYWNTHLFRIDEQSGRLVTLGRVHKATGEFRLASSIDDQRMLLPGYAGALFVYDIRKPWRAQVEDANPAWLGEIGQGQHLALGVARRQDGLIAIATPPTYGQRGGALTLFNSATRTWKTYAGLADEQALSAVCFGARGELYAGTSTDVGLGAAQIGGSARLLVIDPTSGQVKRSLTPANEAVAIVALVALPDGRVLGAGNRGGLFVHEPDTGKTRVVHRFDGQVRDLFWWSQEQTVLALVWRRGVYRIDPRTLVVAPISGAPQTLMPGAAEDRLGRGYVHDGTRVFRIR